MLGRRKEVHIQMKIAEIKQEIPLQKNKISELENEIILEKRKLAYLEDLLAKMEKTGKLKKQNIDNYWKERNRT